LKLCAQGLTAKQIAFRLDRSPATVMLHLKSATRKLGARNRVQAVARAAHYRLLDGAC
jgi:LuxR family transcriptional regulator